MQRSRYPPSRDSTLSTTSHEINVLILTAGTYDNVIRLLMPLNIADEDFREALDVMEAGLKSVSVEIGEVAVAAR